MADRERQGESVRLQVAGAKREDMAKGTARLGQRTFQALGLKEGEIIEIVGPVTTAAVALPPYPEDDGLDLIRLDGLQRTNSGVSIGDYVEVRCAKVEPARRVTLAPAQENLRLMGTGDALRRTLFRRPLTQGDTISTSAYQRTETSRGPEDPGAFPEELFRTFFQQTAYALQEIRLRVVGTTPRGRHRTKA